MNLVSQISNIVILVASLKILTNAKQRSTIFDQFRDDLREYVIPLHYKINLSIEVVDHDFIRTESSIQQILDDLYSNYVNFVCIGQSSTTINIIRSTQQLKLHALNLYLGNAMTLLLRRNGEYYDLIEVLNSRNGFIEINFSDVVLPGIYVLKIEFIAFLTEHNANIFNSSSINTEENRILLVAPNVQMIGARTLFPCWDEPHLRTTFNISIKHHHNYTILSNMPIQNQYYEENLTKVWTQFLVTPPLSTFQISIVLTNFPQIRINKFTYLWCKICSSKSTSLKYASQVINNITLHIDSEFQEIQFLKMDHIAFPSLLHNDIIKWGLIFHREEDLIYDEEFETMRKIEIAHRIAVKIAHQWFENAINRVDSTFYLYDSLAILFGEEAIVKTFNNSQMMDLFIVQNQHDTLKLDSHFNMNPSIRNLSVTQLNFNPPDYMKALIILRMLQNAITDVKFREGIHKYLHTYKFGLVTSHKFWIVQGEVGGTFVINDFLYWLVMKHYPVVILKPQIPYLSSSKNSQVKIVTHPFITLSNKFWILMNLLTETSSISFNLRSDEPLAYFNQCCNHSNSDDRDDWMIIDIQQAGYYRIDYDLKYWRKIAKFLNTKNYKNISVINRAKIIDDACDFLIKHKLNETVFWEIVNYLSQETEYAAWYPMIKMFEYMSSAFPLSNDMKEYEPNFNNFTKKINALLSKPLEILGFEEHPMENDLTKCLRQEIVKWACTVKHPKCLEKANFKLKQHLSNPELYKILPGWKKWTYCIGFMATDTALWEYLRKLLPEYKKYCRANDFLEYLFRFQDEFMEKIFNFLPAIRRKMEESKAKKEDIITIINLFYSILAKHVRNDDIREMILTKFKAATLISIINNIYSIHQLDKISFFLKYEEQIYLEPLELKIFQKIETRKSQIKTHINYFQSFLDSPNTKVYVPTV